MKRIALVYGLLSGAVTVVSMLITIPLLDSMSYRRMEIVGYTSLVLAALLVFFGIRSFRERSGDGKLSFGRAFVAGLAISLVASFCYVTAFELANFVFVPGLGQKYAACMVKQARQQGASPEKLQKVEAQAQMFERLWEKPHTLAAVSFAESFPVGLIASLLSAAILRRK